MLKFLWVFCLFVCLCQNQLSITVWVYFWIFHSVSWNYLFIPRPDYTFLLVLLNKKP